MLGKIHLVTSFHNQIDIHNRWAIESYTFFQLKVKNDSCSINADFASAIKVCFAPYDSSYEDTSEYIPDFRKYTSISASVDIYFRSKFWPLLFAVDTFCQCTANIETVINEGALYNWKISH